MSLTIADVLALPGLDSMRLRAGEAGLDNAVRWPYVAENTGIAEWVLGGELVFVTGINQIGRASCRERVEISVGAGSLKKTTRVQTAAMRE